MPRGAANEVATRDGTDARAKQGAESPGGHGPSAHLNGHHVGNATAADGNGDGTGNAHEEAERHHHADVLAEGGADAEDGEKDVADVVEQRAAVDFAHGGHDQGTKGEAENVDGEEEGGHDGRRLMELGENPADTGSEHGGAEGACGMLATLLEPRK